MSDSSTDGCEIDARRGRKMIPCTRVTNSVPPILSWDVSARVLLPNCCFFFGMGDATIGIPHRAQFPQFELFELILVLKLDKQFPVEQFEATVSQSTVASPPPLKVGSARTCERGGAGMQQGDASLAGICFATPALLNLALFMPLVTITVTSIISTTNIVSSVHTTNTRSILIIMLIA